MEIFIEPNFFYSKNRYTYVGNITKCAPKKALSSRIKTVSFTETKKTDTSVLSYMYV